MGVMVLEPQQPAVGRIDDCSDKDKKKKRRSSRRSKQNSSIPGVACNSVSEQHQEAPKCVLDDNTRRSCSRWKQNGQNEESNVAFSFRPTTHSGDQQAKLDTCMKISLRSSPTNPSFEESVIEYGGMDFVPYHLVDGCSQKKWFDPHWSLEAVNGGLEKGHAFRATFHVNVHNRLEAYCTIDGVPIDVLIGGIPMQNRAVEGDVVAIKVDPPTLWARMKGPIGFPNHSAPPEDNDSFTEIIGDSFKGKNMVDVDCINAPGRNCSPLPEKGFSNMDGPFQEGCFNGLHKVLNSVEKLCEAIIAIPTRRPTGRVVAIIESSPRRDTVVGFLNVKQWLSYRENYKRDNRNNQNFMPFLNHECIQLSPNDPKFPKMMVPVGGLPYCIKKRLDDGDMTIEMELVAAQIDGWREESFLPQAHVMHSFGHGGEMEPQIAAILFENSINSAEFSPESLSCLPHDSWEVTQELKNRKDLRNLCVFTIDPSTATDLDDALSVERLSSDVHRVGVHVADVSYFVRPDTKLDTEAQVRSTSVYVTRHKIPMLPTLLSENLCSLNPGVDRLAFSIFWDINLSGNVINRWMGRTVVRSCCKLSYEHAQDIIDGQTDVDGYGFPPLHGHFEWQDIIGSVRSLHEISKILKEKRLNNGALMLDNSKVVFLLDQNGVPCNSMRCEQKHSNFVVEEFMLLANQTVAEIISRTFPDRALLRRHPEPNIRKLRELEAFCSKHRFELDASSSSSFQRSLEKIREKLKDDSILYDILISYASRSMQMAKYFCSGDIRVSENDRSHYALAVPLYTHFTSPLRRYPDILVHRTLAAAVEAEEMYLKHLKIINKENQDETTMCFTGIYFDELAAKSEEGRQALLAAALNHRVPCMETLSDVAAYCDARKLASRHAEDAVDRVYMWVLLKNKEILISEARVLGLGPRFISIYVHKLAIERRIYYDEVEGLMVEWFEMTSTLVLSFSPSKRIHRRGTPGKFKALEDVALVISPCDLESEADNSAIENGDPDPECQNPDSILKSRRSDSKILPAFFPLTVRLLSTIPVALYAVGGNDGPLDIAASFYMSSYFR